MHKDFLDLMSMSLKEEFNSFIDSYNNDISRGVRINNQYISNEAFLKIAPFSLDKIPYADDGFYLNSKEKYGNHPLHHAGAFYFQEPSAMSVVNSIDFKSDYKVLDLCASPGGKSSQIAIRIPNGMLISNEINYKRSMVLFSNIERQGFRNVIITNNAPNELENTFKGFFDVVLVDAPCSGEGMFRKDEEAIADWNLKKVYECANITKDILESAHKMLKENGILLFSTCTFNHIENEDAIKNFMSLHQYELVDINEQTKSFMKEGTVKKTYHFYPHIAKGEGQFVAVMKKKETSICKVKTAKNSVVPKEYIDFIRKNLEKCEINHFTKNNKLYHLAYNIGLEGLNVINYGVLLGEVVNKRFVPHHNFYKVFYNKFKNKINLRVDDDRVNKYLRGEEINYESPDGYGVILLEGIPLGGFKAHNGIIKNHYPKGLRNF